MIVAVAPMPRSPDVDKTLHGKCGDTGPFIDLEAVGGTKEATGAYRPMVPKQPQASTARDANTDMRFRDIWNASRRDNGDI